MTSANGCVLEELLFKNIQNQLSPVGLLRRNSSYLTSCSVGSLAKKRDGLRLRAAGWREELRGGGRQVGRTER